MRNNMNKEFIPYEQALELKELGFDEPCFGYYNGQGNHIGEEGKMNSNCNKLGMHGAYCTVPLYQQAFRWFREKYGYLASPFSTESEDGNVMYYFEIGKIDKFTVDIYSDDKSTYEEAELACLKKLIEIIKSQNNAK